MHNKIVKHRAGVRITVNLVIANITHYQSMTNNGHYRRNQTAPEFLREIVWCGFIQPSEFEELGVSMDERFEPLPDRNPPSFAR